MRNIKLTIHYDGTHYHGWQIQSRCDSVQGKVLEAIRFMVKEYPIKFVGASRTDTGVHAVGQIGNFWIPEDNTINCHSFYRGLNSLVPNDIIIADVQDVDQGFHARFDACGKTYCYQIFNAGHASMYHRRFSWHIRHALDLGAMRQAAQCLIGCHDFKSFQASSCGSESSIRTMFGIHIQHRKNLVRIFIRANAFLHHMVRNIVGTLFEIGMGRKRAEEMPELLQAKNRTLVGMTAPASGLFLLKVHYQPLFAI